MKYFIFLLAVLWANLGFNQEIIYPIDSILEKARNLFRHNLIIPLDTDSTSYAEAFNFLNFCGTNDSNFTFSYKIFYHKNSIVKLEQFYRNNPSIHYKLFVTRSHGKIFLHGYGWGNYMPGVIVIDSIKKECFFLNIIDDEVNKGSPFFKIPYVMKLDRDLFPIYKIHLAGIIIDYYSNFIYKKNSKILTKEEVFISELFCPQKVNDLKNLSGFDILFSRKWCSYPFASVLPDVPKLDIPMWIYGSYFYE